jgi:thymidylate kinase
LKEAARRPAQIVVIDASRSAGEVQSDVRRAAERILPQ